ncbi:hypothetical protein IFO69_05030 [Echinicola sp. CAU 1574]|uniref:Uncharacterized protein n=1 Tax=Echinicola arenosa TaxID=2774144 RepID=A0ABR9AKJ5_9BACT|nr:hypothetical protein [Echinicola arenosa]MBD8488104.1 hypothetical protein [Echinicola arenosa]
MRNRYSLSLSLSGRTETTRKSGSLETESSAAADGESAYHLVGPKTAAKRLILK